MPRWYALFPKGLAKVFTAYIGIQQHSGLDPGPNPCVAAIENWIAENRHNAPASVERFRLIEGNDASRAHVFVCYWDDPAKYEERIGQLKLGRLYRELDPPQQQTVGLWCERFTSDTSRLETNYSGTDYLPGLARLPGTTPVDHSYTGYWGAARDRIPDAAHDRFERVQGSRAARLPDRVPLSLGKHLTGSNFHNLVYIRSGQFWNNCDEEEKRMYEERLEPTLRKGLSYLWQNPLESGAMGLRYLQNVPPSSPWPAQSNESCVVGFFRNLADLENWAKRHASHLAIYTGAIRHAKTFGEKRRFRTWHEVSVLKGGDAHFEYVNCLPGTGVIKSITLTEASE
ncbi:hypothetical protein BBP40_001587 [Aspergillus hancockii]|nr:hypothetical protein BBP40_001587 [Aspergillus hancockii]